MSRGSTLRRMVYNNRGIDPGKPIPKPPKYRPFTKAEKLLITQIFLGKIKKLSEGNK